MNPERSGGAPLWQPSLAILKKTKKGRSGGGRAGTLTSGSCRLPRRHGRGRGVTSTGPIAGELGVSGEGKEKQINEVLVWEAVSNVIFLKIKRSGWGRCARAWAPGLTWIMELVTLTEQCVGQS